MLPILENLKIGKALVGLIKDPNRTEEIFKMSEIGLRNPDHKYARPVVERALAQPEFRELFEKRYLQPDLTIERLLAYPEGSLGRAWGEFLKRNSLSVVFYPKLEVDLPATYIAMRARQNHDLWHVLTGYDVGVAGELALQGFTLAQLHSGLSAIIIAGGLLHVVKNTPASVPAAMEGIVEGYRRGRDAKYLLGIAFEERLEMPLEEARALAGITPKAVTLH